ncbi:MAG: 23S rRNA (guanosine(2251)-2'-O)-methyltransferase RlmB [Actinomycetota bacterium]
MELLTGRQPVREALRAGRPIKRLLVADGAQSKGVLAEILDLAHAAGVRVERVPRRLMDERAGDAVHQGVLAETTPYRTRSWREGLERARKAGKVPLLLALDGIEDPQNAGALIRSAEVFGVDAVLLPKRRSAPLSHVTAKASAGAIEHLVIDVVSNLERALADCKDEGIWILSLAADAKGTIEACPLISEPVLVVVGAEGTGVSSLIRKRSDAVVRIPTRGKVASLNASVAGAICLYEVAKNR